MAVAVEVWVRVFVIVGVLLANFIIDIVYVAVDPRTRIGMTGGNR